MGHVNTCQKVTMKLILALSALLAISSADQCSDCTAVVTTLATYLTSEESISRQVDVLLAEVCPGAEDVDACVTGLPDFWSRVAMVLWPGYYNAEAEWMCATNGIAASIEQLLSEEFVMGIVDALSGDGFCGME